MDFLTSFGVPMGMEQVGRYVVSLVLAAFLGGMIGVERELRRKAAGLRTHMFICLGAAFFTILSGLLAGTLGGDHTRIAAQIIPGIGFIGAGTILHSRASVTGLTTAATIFISASIGMASGGGFYVLALLVTLIALFGLFLLGWVEGHFGLKPVLATYDVFGASLDPMLVAVNRILKAEQQSMHSVNVVSLGDSCRLQFSVVAGSNEHRQLLVALRTDITFARVQSSEAR